MQMRQSTHAGKEKQKRDDGARAVMRERRRQGWSKPFEREYLILHCET